MKPSIAGLGLAVGLVPAMPADVGVSVSIGQPGFYGRIDIGNFPQPRVIYAEPVIVHRPRAGIPPQRPVYLHVPPGHAKHWDKHCARYDACAQPVYFVQEGWYNDVYAPRYREQQRGGRDGHPGKGRGRGHRDD